MSDVVTRYHSTLFYKHIAKVPSFEFSWKPIYLNLFSCTDRSSRNVWDVDIAVTSFMWLMFFIFYNAKHYECLTPKIVLISSAFRNKITETSFGCLIFQVFLRKIPAENSHITDSRLDIRHSLKSFIDSL